MTRKLFLLSALLIVASSFSYADMVEVKGKGFISGVIVSENDDEIVFKNSYGQVQHFSRSEVTHIEKEKPHLVKGFSMASAKGSLSSVKKTVSDIKIGFSHSASASSAGSAGSFDRWLGSNVGFADQVVLWVNQTSQSALDFLFRGRDTGELTRNIQARATGFKDYKSQNLVVGGIGMAMMFFGALALVVFGFRLISEAFEQHFLWGVAFLAIPLSYAAPLIGGSIGLFAMGPYFASLCFIVIHWRVARPVFVAQLFCSNVILFGFFILQMAS